MKHSQFEREIEEIRGRNTSCYYYIEKEGKSKINNLRIHLKKLEKEGQSIPKVCRRNKVIKIKIEIN